MVKTGRLPADCVARVELLLAREGKRVGGKIGTVYLLIAPDRIPRLGGNYYGSGEYYRGRTIRKQSREGHRAAIVYGGLSQTDQGLSANRITSLRNQRCLCKDAGASRICSEESHQASIVDHRGTEAGQFPAADRIARLLQ